MPHAGTGAGAGDPSAGLLVQFLAWVAVRPRTYAETMEAWRTSCPRISVWEDAVGEGFVEVDGAGAGAQGDAGVMLTPVGREHLLRAGTGAGAVRG